MWIEDNNSHNVNQRSLPEGRNVTGNQQSLPEGRNITANQLSLLKAHNITANQRSLPAVVMNFMIRLLESVRVGQFAKKNRSTRLFVCLFSRVSGSGESWFSVVRLSSSLVLIQTNHEYTVLS